MELTPEGRQRDVAELVRVGRCDELVADLHRAIELFANLAFKSFSGGLACLDLSPWELPHARQLRPGASTGTQDGTILDDHGADDRDLFAI